MNAHRISEPDHFQLLPKPWEVRSNLMREDARRPRSLELVGKYSSAVDSCSKARLHRLSGEFSEKTLAFVVLRLKKTTALCTNKRRKSKRGHNHMESVIARPQTWGPNGTQFAKFLGLLGDQLQDINSRSEIQFCSHREIPEQINFSDASSLLNGSCTTPLITASAALSDTPHAAFGSDDTELERTVAEIEEVKVCESESDKEAASCMTDLEEVVKCVVRDIVSSVEKELESTSILSSPKPDVEEPAVTSMLGCTADREETTCGSCDSEASSDVEKLVVKSCENLCTAEDPENNALLPATDVEQYVGIDGDDDMDNGIVQEDIQVKDTSLQTVNVILSSGIPMEDPDVKNDPLEFNIVGIDGSAMPDETGDQNEEDAATENQNDAVASKEHSLLEQQDNTISADADESVLGGANADVQSLESCCANFEVLSPDIDSAPVQQAAEIDAGTASNLHCAASNADRPDESDVQYDIEKHDAITPEAIDVPGDDVAKQRSDNMIVTKAEDVQASKDNAYSASEVCEGPANPKYSTNNRDTEHSDALRLAEGVGEDCEKPNTDPVFHKHIEVIQYDDAAAPNSDGTSGEQNRCDSTVQLLHEKDEIELGSTEEDKDQVDLDVPLTKTLPIKRRPTSLFYGRWPPTVSDAEKLAILRDLTQPVLAPEVGLTADVFSEETELALESVRVLGRQDSFAKSRYPLGAKKNQQPYEPVKAVVFEEENRSYFNNQLPGTPPGEASDPLVSTPTNSFSFPTANESSAQSWQKCRSLPTKLKPNYTGFDQWNAKEEYPSTDSVSNMEKDAAKTKRDSTISRGSAASSGTVVASDEETEQSKELAISVAVASCSHSADHIRSYAEMNGGEKTTKTVSMKRSKSLDRHNGPMGVLLSLKHAVTPASTKNGRRATRGVNAATSTPVMNVTSQYTGREDSDSLRLNPDQLFLPNRSSSSLSFTTSDESEPSPWDSRCSSVPSSPTISPRLHQTNGRNKFKGLREQETKVAERQAMEACSWLRAAGFPQYAHLYEVGSFPVDIESATIDHDFLGQDHIAALVRRLNVLNKCASMKLDKSTTKDAQTDDDDDEDEQCAISEYWHFEEDGRRWSRLDSKSASSRGAPSVSSFNHMPFLGETREDSAAEVFDGDGADYKPVIDGQSRIAALKAKPKSSSFLKRVGGDLMKFRTGSFRRTTDPAGSKQMSKNLAKANRKNRKIVIGEPMLQSGHEKIDKLRCMPIEQSDPETLHWRKDSVQSLTSSSSSSGSGAASSASTPAPRVRSFTEDFGLHEEAISPGLFDRNRTLLEYSSNLHKSRSQTLPDPESTLFLMPKDHVPGTFPASMRTMDSMQDESYPALPQASTTSTSSDPDSQGIPRVHRPVSVYDNLPESALQGAASAQDLLNIMDPGALSVSDSGVFVIGSEESLDVAAQQAQDAFWSVDDIVEHTQFLQQAVSAWEDQEEQKNERSDSRSVDAMDQLSPAGVIPSYSSENVSFGEDETNEPVKNREQRTSFRQTRLRWQSFKGDHTPCSISQPLQLHNLSVGQLMMLRRLSLLRLTTLLDRFNTTKGSGSGFVPRFIRRIKVPDYKDKAVFGVPLLHNMQRFGQPLPQCIQHALAYLRRTALDQVGLFRKPGVRSRIHKLRTNCENDPLLTNFEECSSYDVADMVKQYFRDLPDPLMTMKLSDTFIGIFLYVPKEFWLQTLQAAITLLPDESRETLQTLLCFLSDVASRSSENHMNETNLATCFAPSLFYQQFSNLKTITSSPKVRKQQGLKGSSAPLGRPDMKEMNDGVAANDCLAFMIRHVKNLFMISEDAMTQCRMSVMQQNEDVLADEIGYTTDMGDENDYYADFHAYVDRTVTQAMREEQRISQNKGGWQSVPGSSQGCEIMFKKMNDGNPLRMWRCQVEVTGASVEQVMDRILNENELWDDDLLESKVLQQPDERTQLYQTVRAEMSPHPTRDYCVLRSWRNKVNTRGSSIIVETSTGQQPLLGDVRGVVLTSRYIIEPTDNPLKCILTRQCRVDTKGRNPEWYNKAYGHIVSQQLLQIRNSILEVPPKSQ